MSLRVQRAFGWLFVALGGVTLLVQLAERLGGFGFFTGNPLLVALVLLGLGVAILATPEPAAETPPASHDDARTEPERNDTTDDRR